MNKSKGFAFIWLVPIALVIILMLLLTTAAAMGVYYRNKYLALAPGSRPIAGGGNIIVGNGECAIPVKSYSGFGYEYGEPTSYNNSHTGIDFMAPNGTPVLATMDGIIYKSVPNECNDGEKYPHCSNTSPGSGFGNYIIIKHNNGQYSHYHHLSEGTALPEGTIVKKGDIIAYSDNNGYSSGPHLHFQLNKNSSDYNNDIDPRPCLGL